MSVLGLVSVVVAVAALFGWLSARVLRVPQTIGSMGLTVFASVVLILLSGVAPGLHGWAVAAMREVDLRGLILHGVLGLLLFAGAFLLNLEELRRQRLTVGMLSVFADAAFDGWRRRADVPGAAVAGGGCELGGVPAVWRADFADGPDCGA